VRILRGELEKAAREFSEPTATEFELDVSDFHDTPEFQAADFHTNEQNDTKPGPEPYAVIHRRFNVVPEIPSAHVSSDFAL
jgi:hypothetical protein